jgi:hypothetical protein
MDLKMQSTAIKYWLPAIILVGSSFLWNVPAIAAPKTDTVTFKNGDKLTGEFKSLKRGHLNLNADATGTIGIEWDKIQSVVTSQNIQIETDDGTRYFGTLAPSFEGAKVVVVTVNGPQSLDADKVITMTPIDGGGFHALDIEASVGYDFAKAGGVTHGTLAVNMDYRSRIRIESISFSTIVTDSSTQDVSQRANLGLAHTRLWKDRWFTTGGLTFDQNDELGLNLRTSIGFGGGRFFVQSNAMLLSWEAGLQFSREDQIDEPDDTDSLEAVFTVNWDWFLFDNPELDWSTRFQLIPSLTETGRVRGELDTTLSWEIIGDLDWAISLYSSWDNQPHSDVGSTSDYGVNTALSYDF